MNAIWRKINEFLAVSGIGKKQSALGEFLADADLDTRENCTLEMNIEVERGAERSCDKRDLVGEPVKRRLRQFRLTFEDPTPQQIFRYIAYMAGSVSEPTGTAQNEVQTLTRSGTVSGGGFPLSLSNFEGRSGTTKVIPYDATAAAIQAAILDQAKTLSKIIKPGDVVVSGDWTAGIAIAFAKRLAKANLPALIVGAGVTGGGSIVNTQTTAGGNFYHTAQRSADGSKPHFTFATGDKEKSIATRKYGDAVVDSIDFTISTDQTNIQMVVVVWCSFIPELVSNFPVPACIKNPAVKVEDVRLKIAGTYEHRSLVNHAISLNDNVPTAASFVFDDKDVSSEFVAGDQPTQNFTTEIFGNSEHELYVLAEEEFVEGNEVEFITHLGNPGNRVSVIADETKIKPQAQPDGFSGEANQSTIKINGTPYGISDIPIRFEAMLSQNEEFLQEG